MAEQIRSLMIGERARVVPVAGSIARGSYISFFSNQGRLIRAILEGEANVNLWSRIGEVGNFELLEKVKVHRGRYWYLQRGIIVGSAISNFQERTFIQGQLNLK